MIHFLCRTNSNTVSHWESFGELNESSITGPRALRRQVSENCLIISTQQTCGTLAFSLQIIFKVKHGRRWMLQAGVSHISAALDLPLCSGAVAEANKSTSCKHYITHKNTLLLGALNLFLFSSWRTCYSQGNCHKPLIYVTSTLGRSPRKHFRISMRSMLFVLKLKVNQAKRFNNSYYFFLK